MLISTSCDIVHLNQIAVSAAVVKGQDGSVLFSSIYGTINCVTSGFL